MMIQSLLFSPDPNYLEMPRQYGLVSEDVEIMTQDQTKLFGWFLPAENPKGILLFSHGNAGNISGRLYKAKGWVERGYSVLLWDYRGYGKSTGENQSDEQMVEDARLFYRWIESKIKSHPVPIIFYGESLGTYIALRLGVDLKPAAVILEAPYTSFVDMAPVHYPWIPKPMVEAMLKSFHFVNMDYAGKLRSPLFILHGTQDPTCPFSMGEKIFEEALQPKKFWAIQGGAHNDLPDVAGKSYWDLPAEFLSKFIR